jgi:hypothetical protein
MIMMKELDVEERETRDENLPCAMRLTFCYIFSDKAIAISRSSYHFK